MMPRRETVAQVTKEYLIEKGEHAIAWDMYGALDDIAERCFDLGISKILKMHPLDRHITLLNRLEGSKLFTKGLYRIVTGGDGNWNRESLCRIFTLVKPNE